MPESLRVRLLSEDDADSIAEYIRAAEWNPAATVDEVREMLRAAADDNPFQPATAPPALAFHRPAPSGIFDIDTDIVLERQGAPARPLAQGMLGPARIPEWADWLSVTKRNAEACRFGCINAGSASCAESSR